jgi:putative tryptophan/tyrosine transport system substrate-binding protein
MGGTLVAYNNELLSQGPEPVHRIGILNLFVESDPEWQRRHMVLVQSLHELGWTDGRNLQIVYRHGAGEDSYRIQTQAAELVHLKLDVILAGTTAGVKALQQESSSIPIVFCGLINPVERGVVESLSHPGSRTTGFTGVGAAIGEKWLQFLREIAPHVTRVAGIHYPNNPLWPEIVRATEPTAAQSGVQLSTIEMYDTANLESLLEAFAKEPGGGVIVPPAPITK